jgi:hypothetical protein
MHKNKVRKITAAKITPKKTIGQSSHFRCLKPVRCRLLDLETNITSKINNDIADNHQTPIIAKMSAGIIAREYNIFLFMGCWNISHIDGWVTSFN